MAAHLKLSSDDVIQLRTHYQGFAQDVFRILWHRKLLILLFATGGLVLGVAVSILLQPRYKSEAILYISFNRDEPNTATKTQRIASMEAAALVESAVRVLRSRALSGAVVSRLGLANDPAFSTPPRLMRAVWAGRGALGLPVAVPSAHDIAVDRLSSALDVNVVPRTYVITAGIVAGEPARAAQLTNTVVLEYLRSKRVQQLVDLQQSLERDIAEMSTVYGPSHPRRVEMKEKSQDLVARVAALRSADLSVESALAEGAEFAPAEPVMIPSGPSVPIVILLVLVASLLLCGGIIALLEMMPHVASRIGIPASNADTIPPTSTEHSPTQDAASTRRFARAGE